MEFIDKTGQPQSDENIAEALQTVTGYLVRPFRERKLRIDPELFVLFPIIRDALKELQKRRAGDPR